LVAIALQGCSQKAGNQDGTKDSKKSTAAAAAKKQAPAATKVDGPKAGEMPKSKVAPPQPVVPVKAHQAKAESKPTPEGQPGTTDEKAPAAQSGAAPKGAVPTKGAADAHGKKPSTKGAHGKKVPAVAVGTPPKGLEGKWVIDPEGIKELAEFKALSDVQRKTAISMMSRVKMEMSFGAANIVLSGNFMGKTGNESTPFKILKTDGNTITIQAVIGGEKQTQVLEAKGERLIVRVGRKSMVFKRKK